MSAATDLDVIVVGAGHNGLAATALLAKRGLRVLCLEKNAYVGGMAGTREILSGCRNDVGASLLFPLAKGLEAELELTRYGVEFIDLPIMASNLNSRHSPPAIFYANPLRMAAMKVTIMAEMQPPPRPAKLWPPAKPWPPPCPPPWPPPCPPPWPPPPPRAVARVGARATAAPMAAVTAIAITVFRDMGASSSQDINPPERDVRSAV